MNTPLMESSFEGVTPKRADVKTPNMMLGTPFRTPHSEGQGIDYKDCRWDKSYFTSYSGVIKMTQHLNTPVNTRFMAN